MTRVVHLVVLIASLAGRLSAMEPGERVVVNATIANSIGMRFVRIAGGEFWMGSNAADSLADADEQPRHRVRITRPYWLGVHEVTQGQFEHIMAENPSWFSRSGGGRESVRDLDTARLPVEFVSWDDAMEFCRRLGLLPAERAAGRSYRLPTEAEWEFACRAGTSTCYSTGDVLTDEVARVPGVGTRLGVLAAALPLAREVGPTRPVGSYPPNALGLHDMHGNVWEWCADRYTDDYYATSPVEDPSGPDSGTGHVVRGGDWFFDVHHARSANRDFTRTTRRDLGNGFRVVMVDE